MSPPLKIWLWLCLPILTCCHPQTVLDGRNILAVADSSCVHGGALPDSTLLANMTRQLAPWKYAYPTEYAKANYYYGRFLRASGHYSDAMQSFIKASQSRTKNHSLTGRVYTNIADICHLEGSYDLSYDFFERAARAFWGAKDTAAYCYALCDMAVELVQKDCYPQADSLLAEAEDLSQDTCLLAHIWLIKAMRYRHAKQYDSAIVCINHSQEYGQIIPSGYVIKAQAFSFAGQTDSAIYYANKAIAISQSLFDLNNMYYILANDDKQDIETIRRITSQRSDIQKQIEIRQGELSHAVEILTTEMNKPYDWRWIYLLIGCATLLGAYLMLSLTRKRHMSIQQDIETQQSLQEQLSETQRQRYKTALAEFERNCAVLRALPNLERELCWNDYDRMCEIVNGQLAFLAGKLQQTQKLNEKEIRLCILVAIGVSYKKMAEMLPYALSGLSKFKYTTAQKLDVSVKDLRQKLANLAVEGGIPYAEC